jgi:hypothetical protein
VMTGARVAVGFGDGGGKGNGVSSPRVICQCQRSSEIQRSVMAAKSPRKISSAMRRSVVSLATKLFLQPGSDRENDAEQTEQRHQTGRHDLAGAKKFWKELRRQKQRNDQTKNETGHAILRENERRHQEQQARDRPRNNGRDATGFEIADNTARDRKRTKDKKINPGRAEHFHARLVAQQRQSVQLTRRETRLGLFLERTCHLLDSNRRSLERDNPFLELVTGLLERANRLIERGSQLLERDNPFLERNSKFLEGDSRFVDRTAVSLSIPISCARAPFY